MMSKDRTELSISAYACPADTLYDNLEYFSFSYADTIHIDLMDGICVPLTGVTCDTMEVLARTSRLPFDVHMMVAKQEATLDWLLTLDRVSTIICTIERQNSHDVLKILSKIRKSGCYSGVAIWPETSIRYLEPFLDVVDEIVVMSTKAGIPNSVFLEESFSRVSAIKSLIQDTSIRIVVDGSMNYERGKRMVDVGAERLVVGRSFFDSDERILLQKLRI